MQKTVGAAVTDYYYNGSLLLGQKTGTAAQYYSYDASGNLLAIYYGGAYYYYLRNGQGDIVGLLDGTGAVVVSYSYDAWGKVLSVSGTLAATFHRRLAGWVNAANLRAGDILATLNGETVTVERVQHELLENPFKVFNFEVDGVLTYFVGNGGVLVHNICVATNGSYKADVKKGGDPNHALGHAHIYHGKEDIASVSEKGEILAGYLDRGARVFVKKFLPQIAAGIARWYYAGSK